MSRDLDDIEPKHVEAFVQVLTRDQRRILLYIHSLIPNWGEAEEVLQNTNLVLWRKYGEFQLGTNFYGWACSVAHLEVLKWRERRARDSKTLSVEFIDEVGRELVRQGDLIERRHQALAACLDKLRDYDRRLILLRYSDGATTQSVAESLNRPIKSIYAAVNRIRDSLLECINRTLAHDGMQARLAVEDRP
jgi:RNA polymerase sigma-70 factor (ECF subfamily)